LLGTAHEERVAALATAVLQKDAKKTLETLADLVGAGQQIGELLDQMIEYWRDLMVVRCAGAAAPDLSVSGPVEAALRQQAESLSLDTILAGLDILATAKTRLRTASQARVVLEMALVRLVQVDELVPLAQLAQWVSKEGAAPSRPGAKSAAGPVNSVKSLAASAIPGGSEKKKLASEPDTGATARTLKFSEENLPAIWQQVIADAGFALASELRKVNSIAISGPNTLVLRVSERYNTPGSSGDPSRWSRVEPLLSRVVGQPCLVRVEAIAVQAAQEMQPSGTRQLREKVKQLPQVQKARDLFGAEILHVDADFGDVATPAQPSDEANGEEPAEEE
jgi:DNA polymerase-3 subunit gamma/tau